MLVRSPCRRAVGLTRRPAGVPRREPSGEPSSIPHGLRVRDQTPRFLGGNTWKSQITPSSMGARPPAVNPLKGGACMHPPSGSRHSMPVDQEGHPSQPWGTMRGMLRTPAIGHVGPAAPGINGGATKSPATSSGQGSRRLPPCRTSTVRTPPNCPFGESAFRGARAQPQGPRRAAGPALVPPARLRGSLGSTPWAPPEAGTSSQVSRRESLEKPDNTVILPRPSGSWEALRPQVFTKIAQF